jgi:hypothetical protein
LKFYTNAAFAWKNALVADTNLIFLCKKQSENEKDLRRVAADLLHHFFIKNNIIRPKTATAANLSGILQF